MRFKIYIIENLINGKVYVGKTSKSVEKRWNDHLKKAKAKENRRLYDSINKYGSENFKIAELDSADDEEKINEMESWYIHIFRSYNKEYGYNMTFGGDGGNTISGFSEERRKEYSEKLSMIRKGFKHSLESKIKMSENSKGKKLTEESRNKISNTLRKKIEEKLFIPDTSGLKKGQDFGFKHTKKSKEKMSLSRKGKKYEDIYGGDLASEIKNKKKLNWAGEKNPLYVNIDKEELLKKIKELPYMKDVASYFSTSVQTIGNKCIEHFNKKYKELKNGEF